MAFSTWGARARSAVGCVVVLVALVACSSGSGADDAPVAAPSSAAASAAAVVASASPGATVAPLPVLASRAGNGDGPLQVDINAVVVEPKFTRVTFTLWNKAELGGSSWQIFDMLNDGVYQMKTGQNTTFQDAWTVDGVYLVDTVNAKRYLAARTTAGACVCSDNLRERVEPQEGVALWSLFQPLPAGVDTIDISVPKVGLFEKVPVSR